MRGLCTNMYRERLLAFRLRICYINIVRVCARSLLSTWIEGQSPQGGENYAQI